MDLRKKTFYKFKLRENDIDKTVVGFELTLKGINLFSERFKFL